MAVSDVEFEAVLEFFRKHGLSEAESALLDDFREKSHLGSSDFEKFVFPMVPPPPPVKIQATRKASPPSPKVVDGGGDEGLVSSDEEEFVSLGSSTTDLCSSDFTNPYGIRTTTRATSIASSDRLSQFGTARDYPDFDMQNDLFWYKERDEDYDMPPLFVGRDSNGDPGEDKHIMSVGNEKQDEGQLRYNNLVTEKNTNGFGNGWPLTTVENTRDETCKDFYDLSEKFHFGGSEEKGKEGCVDYSCSSPFCPCCRGARRDYSRNSLDSGLVDLKLNGGDDIQCYPLAKQAVENDSRNFLTKRNPTYDWIGGFNNMSDFQSRDIEKDGSECEDDAYETGERAVVEESPEPDAADDEEGNGMLDELLMYETKEDDYEIFNLRIIHRKNRTGFEENKDLPIVLNSIIAGRYYITEFLGSAAFSKVIQAHDLHSGMDVCLKIIKNDKDFFDQSLDEIKLLKFVNKHDPHDEHHILRLYDYFYHQEHLFIVTELLRANLYEFQKYNQESGSEPYFTMNRLQVITRQCLEALEYLHGLGIIHCDLKPENILIKSYRRCEIKVIDLGSSCFQTDNLSLYVQSRSYRAPEVILGLSYDHKIDIWSLGCILAELYSGEVLFPNEALVMLLARVIGILGPIDMDMLERGQETHKYFTKEYDLYHINEETNQLEYIIPKGSSLENHLQISDPGFIDFVRYLLEINPEKRPTTREALGHPWLSYPYEVNPC